MSFVDWLILCLSLAGGLVCGLFVYAVLLHLFPIDED